eukprot:4366454-Amphidinium_carterae.1
MGLSDLGTSKRHLSIPVPGELVGLLWSIVRVDATKVAEYQEYQLRQLQHWLLQVASEVESLEGAPAVMVKHERAEIEFGVR